MSLRKQELGRQGLGALPANVIKGKEIQICPTKSVMYSTREAKVLSMYQKITGSWISNWISN